MRVIRIITHGSALCNSFSFVYVSVETQGIGVQVFSPAGRYLRSLANAPADLHGFVIRDAGDGEHLYGVSLRGQKFVKLTLDGEIVLEISRDAIPREYWTPNRYLGSFGGNRMPPEQWRTGYVVAPHGVATNAAGDLFVAEFSTFGRVHKFDRR